MITWQYFAEGVIDPELPNFSDAGIWILNIR